MESDQQHEVKEELNGQSAEIQRLSESLRILLSSFNSASNEIATLKERLSAAESRMDSSMPGVQDLVETVDSLESFRGEAEAVMDGWEQNGFTELLGEPYSLGIRRLPGGRAQVTNVDRVFHRFRPIREGAESEALYFTRGSWFFWKEVPADSGAFVLREAELSDEFTRVEFTAVDQKYVVCTLDRSAETVALSVAAAVPLDEDKVVVAEVASVELLSPQNVYATGKITRRQLCDIHEGQSAVFEIPEHNDLDGLQGGDPSVPAYYHLSGDQYDQLIEDGIIDPVPGTCDQNIHPGDEEYDLDGTEDDHPGGGPGGFDLDPYPDGYGDHPGADDCYTTR